MRRLPTLLAAAALCGAGLSQAQPVPPDRLREQLRDTVLQLRSLQTEHRALQLREQQLAQQLQALQQAPRASVPEPAAKPAPAVDPRRLTALRQQLAQEQQAHADTRGRLQAGEAALGQAQGHITRLEADTRRQAQSLETLRSQLQVSEARQGAAAQAVARCAADNRELAALGEELLQSYRRKDVWAALRDDEPLLGLGRVRMENLMQTWRGRLEDHRAAPAAVPVPSAD